MEDVLSVYCRPYDPKKPQVCLDECSKHLLSDLTDIRIDTPDRAESHENAAETPVLAAMERLKRAASS